MSGDEIAKYACALFDDVSLPIVIGISRNVVMTIVGGRIVVRDGLLVGGDEEALAARVQALAVRMVAAASRRTGINYLRRR